MNKALLQELLQLSPAERVEIAQELLDSVEETELPPLTPEQMQEIDRRIAEHERDPSRAIPWEKVRERLRARFKSSWSFSRKLRRISWTRRCGTTNNQAQFVKDFCKRSKRLWP